jgi:membrane dipeptidase
VIFDGHNDLLLRLAGNVRSFFQNGHEGHLDLPRMRKGGFAGGFFAMFVPHDPSRPAPSELDREVTASAAYSMPLPEPLSLRYAQERVLEMFGDLYRIERDSAGAFRVATSTKELDGCLDAGVIAAIPHFEGAEPIDPELRNLPVYYAAGLRSIGLVWSRPNAFGTGVSYSFPSSPDIGPGLTDAGKRLVDACNEWGIVVDLSHITEKGFWDVAGRTDAPLVASHSCAHALCPTSRNLTDAQLDAIAESGGVVGVNFHVSFLRADGKVDAETPLDAIVAHIDYMVERMGIDHVALGSDFDGACMPNELKDVAGLPRLIGCLAGDGYGENDLRKICRDNWLRVIRATWKGVRP